MYKDAAGMAGGFSRNLIILRDDISKRAQQKSSRDWRNFSTHIFVGCSADEAGGAAGGLILLRIEPIIFAWMQPARPSFSSSLQHYWALNRSFAHALILPQKPVFFF